MYVRMYVGRRKKHRNTPRREGKGTHVGMDVKLEGKKETKRKIKHISTNSHTTPLCTIIEYPRTTMTDLSPMSFHCCRSRRLYKNKASAACNIKLSGNRRGRVNIYALRYAII
jgi:hypothetical protein